MKAIKDVIKHMEDTLDEAHEYYDDYIKYEEEYPKLSETALDMAKTHLELYTKWHNVVMSIIDDYRKSRGEAPGEMKAIWNYEHEKLMDEYNELKYKIMKA